MGIEEARTRLDWISASEGEKVRTVINEFVGTVQELGPLGIPGRLEAWDQEVAHIEEAVRGADKNEAVTHAG
jgi:F420-non-reducing hydrogenase iron-sulfur subunit